MKIHYPIKRKVTITILALTLVAFSQTVKAQFPVPDQALTFDETHESYEPQVNDISGNENDAYWWTYRNGTEEMFGGYRPTAGKYGGSWYISGYHLCCEEMASPSLDFVLLAGNQHVKDAEGFKDSSALYHGGFKKFSVAFWFKSDRDYTANHTPCQPDPVGMHEQEILFSMGSTNGFGISNLKGYYDVKIGYKPAEGDAETKQITYLYTGDGAVNKEWQHITVTFDGTNNGMLTFYLNGEIASTYLGDPNPLETGYPELLPNSTSTEIGAQNNGGLFGNVTAFWNSDRIGQFCITDKDTTYRTGWPAAGYFDDFVFYKDVSLSQEEIQKLYTLGIDSILYGGSTQTIIVPDYNLNYNIYPNPTVDKIKISSNNNNIKNINLNFTLHNILGELVLEKYVVPNETIDISFLKTGLYIAKVNGNTSKLLIK